MSVVVSSLLACLLAPPTPSQDPTIAPEGPVFEAMTDELHRTSKLKLADSPSPHYIAYHVFDARGVSASARFGALTSTDTVHVRQLSPTVRVGLTALDSTGFSGRMDLLLAPVEDDYDALRRRLWLLSDEMYKTATERFRQEQASRKQTTREKDAPDSFSSAKISQHAAPTVDHEFDDAAMEATVVDASAVFRSHPNVQSSWVRVTALDLRHRMMASDGARVDESRSVAEFEVFAAAQAEDGLPIRRSESVLALDPAQLPSAEEAKAMAERVAQATEAARTLPVADNFDGPVLYEGEAAAELMAFVLPQELTAMPFASEDGRLGRRVLPKNVSIVDDPTQTKFGDTTLFGHYEVDFEGVAAQRVALVDRGEQVGMLMGRTPNRELDASNGHARGTFPGMTMVTPGNLLVQVKGGKSDKALRAKLVQLIKKEGFDHGYIVTDLGGSPWSPAAVLRIDPKGKTEPVRVDQMRMPEFGDLRRIVALGKDPVVFNYMTAGGSPVGGLSGGAQETVVPASVVCPSILFDQVEIKKATGDKPKPPPYPHPYFVDEK